MPVDPAHPDAIEILIGREIDAKPVSCLADPNPDVAGRRPLRASGNSRLRELEPRMPVRDVSIPESNAPSAERRPRQAYPRSDRIARAEGDVAERRMLRSSRRLVRRHRLAQLRRARRSAAAVIGYRNGERDSAGDEDDCCYGGRGERRDRRRLGSSRVGPNRCVVAVASPVATAARKDSVSRL